MIRNLLYSCFAANWNDEWQLNVTQLNKYSSIFNGRKIVIIRSDESTVSPKRVKQEFKFPVEFIHVKNDKTLWETHYFLETLEKLKSLRGDEITFYAHTKGVRHKGQTADFMQAIRDWRNIMYCECLSDPNKIDKVMSGYACCGCFRTPEINYEKSKKEHWIFAGTYFWLNHLKLFSRDWQRTVGGAYAVEAYPSLIFNRKESYCLHGDDAALYQIFSEVYDQGIKGFCPRCGMPYRLDKTSIHYICKSCGLAVL